MTHVPQRIILASASEARKRMLAAAGLDIEIVPARLDEEAIRESLLDDGAGARDIADALAEAKAARVAGRNPDALVIGSDQTLEIDGTLLTKAESRAAARDQLLRLADRTHRLHAAAVIFEDARPIWRHVSTATLTVHPLTDAAIDRYLDRNWPQVAGSLGCYRIEEEGVRLFSAVRGSHFAILGLPLIELLSYLTLRGVLRP